MRTHRRGLALVATLVVGGLQAPATGAVDGYTVTELPGLGSRAVAYAVSPNGRYAAGSARIGGGWQAVRWDAGTPEPLSSPAGTAMAEGYAVGDDGTVVGWTSGCTTAGCVQRAVRWRILMPREDLGEGSALGMSSSGGLVAGWSSGGPTIWGGALSSEVKAEPRGSIWAIDDTGRAVGSVATDAGDRPVVWAAGASTSTPLDLPSGVSSGIAFAMSGADIAGATGSAGSTPRVALWRNGVRVALSVPAGSKGRPGSSMGRDVNAAGTLVGDANGRATRWLSGQHVDLNTFLPRKSGLLLTQAFGVSEGGHIVGAGRRGDVDVAFLLTPRSGS